MRSTTTILFYSIHLILLALVATTAFAHDPLEISATVYLHTNRIELRAVMMRQVVMRVADRQAVPLLDFSIPAEREEAMPMLRSLAGGLFTLSCGTNFLRATETNVILGAEDHVGVNLTYPSTNATLQLDARLLAHLPSEDPYGVSVIVLDMANNKVLEQKLLNAQNPTMEIALPQKKEAPNPKLQAPEKHQSSNFKPSPPKFWSLRLGASLDVGCWMLELLHS